MRFELVLGEIYHVVGVLTSWIGSDHIIGESFTFFTKMMLGKKKEVFVYFLGNIIYQH
jgi:hypothetical protein